MSFDNIICLTHRVREMRLDWEEAGRPESTPRQRARLRVVNARDHLRLAQVELRAALARLE